MELAPIISNAKCTEVRTRLQTNITDVNIDCLEEVFKYFDLKDLLNVADCGNQRMRRAASFVFASTYQSKIKISHSRIGSLWRIKYYLRLINVEDSEVMRKKDLSLIHI